MGLADQSRRQGPRTAGARPGGHRGVNPRVTCGSDLRSAEWQKAFVGGLRSCGGDAGAGMSSARKYYVNYALGRASRALMLRWRVRGPHTARVAIGHWSRFAAWVVNASAAGSSSINSPFGLNPGTRGKSRSASVLRDSRGRRNTHGGRAAQSPKRLPPQRSGSGGNRISRGRCRLRGHASQSHRHSLNSTSRPPPSGQFTGGRKW